MTATTPLIDLFDFRVKRSWKNQTGKLNALAPQTQKAGPSIVCSLVRDFGIWAFYHTLSAKCQFR